MLLQLVVMLLMVAVNSWLLVKREHLMHSNVPPVIVTGTSTGKKLVVEGFIINISYHHHHLPPLITSTATLLRVLLIFLHTPLGLQHIQWDTYKLVHRMNTIILIYNYCKIKGRWLYHQLRGMMRICQTRVVAAEVVVVVGARRDLGQSSVKNKRRKCWHLLRRLGGEFRSRMRQLCNNFVPSLMSDDTCSKFGCTITNTLLVDLSKPGPPPQEAAETPWGTRNANKVYKSGPLFLSSKGLGWTSWKKRWFILTSTSLVFFRSDPNAILPKGSEVNCTLGGIDLNSSGSVVVKEDKKLITVQFSDGHDGRIFTLKAERLEDLNEWKAALEEALANAPNTGISVMQNETFNNDQANAADASVDQRKDIQPEKSLVIGRPVLLALENADGTPSFLEKALRFVEEHGVKVEGILRQAADVEDVEHRIREFEQGKTDFSPEEDAHVIADCVKYVLRELSSPPIPASCCKALVEAARTERSKKLAAMRHAIYETFPEPNCRLLQRILMMMHNIAANMAENRMSVSAVAACMAPLLLRPLLAGECELEQKSDAEGDGSVQLLQAAAAANNAQAICITLLEEYDNLFAEGTMSSDLYSETEESGSESEEHSNEGETSEDYSDDDATDGDIEEDYEHTSSGRRNEAGGTVECDERSGSSHSGSLSEDFHETLDDDKKLVPTMTSNNASVGGEQNKDNLNASCEQGEVVSAELQSKPAEQADWKEKLLESLERWRIGLLDWQIALEEDVPRLEEQLQKESELTTALEAGLGGSQGPRNMSANCDEKTMETFGEIARVELEIDNLKQKADGLREKLNHQRAQNFRLLHM
ncbi:hypothetical protein Leryth_017576 [Lithospermum erythrorhizon]|nr:hypothetical protein Leryth_017576 [Lithospermum erythrorhizon]